MVAEIFEDGLFAAIAAIGFSSISNTPVRAYGACAVVAAVGHAIRYVLMTVMGFHIIPASSIAAFAVGLLSAFIIIGMVLSANIPVFLWKKVSFRATR